MSSPEQILARIRLTQALAKAKFDSLTEEEKARIAELREKAGCCKGKRIDKV